MFTFTLHMWHTTCMHITQDHGKLTFHIHAEMWVSIILKRELLELIQQILNV